MTLRSNLIDFFFLFIFIFYAWNNLLIRAITNSGNGNTSHKESEKSSNTPFPFPSNHKTFARLCRTPGCIKLSQPIFQHLRNHQSEEYVLFMNYAYTCPYNPSYTDICIHIQQSLNISNETLVFIIVNSEVSFQLLSNLFV